MFDSRILLVASSVIAVAVATSVHAQMPPQQPDTKAFKIGSLDVVALHDAQFVRIHTRKAAELDRAQAHGLKYGEAVAQAMY
jgi:hypothetical protein